MKYKLYGLLSVFLTCVTILVTLLIFKTDDIKKDRYIQHLDSASKEECTHGDNALCTHLPIVVIDTGGIEIPGKAYHNSDGTDSFTVGPDGEDEIDGKISIYDSRDNNNHLSDEPAVESSILIHVRGNSSRFFDKLGYSVRLLTEDGEQNSVAVMGMGEHHEWVLHGPFLDKTLIRNYMWYNIAGQIMEYAPEVRFCEVYINGDYKGLYVMCENITAGEDRLQLKVNKKDNTFTGYLLRLDRGSDTEFKNIETFGNYTYRNKMILNIVYPGNENLNDELRTSIIDDFSAFEKTIYSYDYNNDKYGYENLIDVQSFVDFFIINEFTCNYDAGNLSTYIYKDFDGKYKLAVWDFNNSCDNYLSKIETDGFSFQNCLWYNMLIKDEYFVEQIISRYEYLRNTILSEEYLYSFIDDTIAFLGDSVDRNFDIWGYMFDLDQATLTLEPSSRNSESFQEAIDQLKYFIHVRGVWLDENIGSLRQYCAGSKNKKFDADAN
ncbi:MAG: CotH kinase family protein [Erysipelotrichaceae bacterium]